MMSKLVPLEFGNQRILTTEQLAEIYETSIDNIKVNFNNHKSNFEEGKHYYLLKGQELKAFKNQVNDIYPVDKHTASLYLWTERGANRHCKILDTDKAWNQFDNLEENYFNPKQRKLSAMDQLKLQYQVLEEHEEKLNRIEKKVNTEFSNLPLLGVDCDEIVKTVKSIATKALGGYQETPAYRDKSLNHKVYSDIYNQLKREFQVNSYKSIKRCQLEHAKEIVRAYKLPTALEDEIVQVNNQVYFEEV